MAWVLPTHSAAEVDAAGNALRAGSARPHASDAAFAVIDNFRAAHAFPLNTFQVYLRKKAHDVDPYSFQGQRLKRFPAIHAKLHRFAWLQLSEMQDIGGCRAVMSSIPRVRSLVRAYKESRIKHDLIDEDDYITGPKRSGYRGMGPCYDRPRREIGLTRR